LARAGEPLLPVDLAAHEAVVYTQGPSSMWAFERAGTVTSVTAHGRLRMSSAEGLSAAVLADMGLANASRWTFAPELSAGAVRQVLGAWVLPAVDLWAVFPSGRQASSKARAFADFVAALLRTAE
jgi:DNA-binding transcriptional LysR family regulator